MKALFALFVALATAPMALPAEGPPPTDAPAPVVKVGDTYPQVLAKRGHPTSEMDGGAVRILYYADVTVKFRNDVAVDVAAAPGGQAWRAPEGAASSSAASGQPALVLKEDAVEGEIGDFGRIVLGRLEEEKFADLEALSVHIIKEKSLFGDGSWKILRFHEALEPSADDPDATWAAREVKITKWEQQQPDSITARTVHVGFLAAYAWRARGPGSADSSMGVRPPLFNNRLAQAADLYQSSRAMPAKSPMLWFEGQRVALGQGWPSKDVVRGFEEAKRAEPEFWHYDGQIARFLLPRWYGKDGDWEKLEEAEIQRGDGLGVEAYARTVFEVSRYSKNVFKESHIEWAFVKEGYGFMMQKYPASRKLLNQLALLSFLAADRPSGVAALEAMKGQADPSVWGQRSISEFQAWAVQRP